MSFLRFLFGTGPCSACKTPGAKFFLGSIKCPNRACGHFDADLHYRSLEAAAGVAREGKKPAAPQSGDFDPGSDTVKIGYTNFRGENKTFQGDKTSIKKKGRHVTIRLMPTGKRCAFLIDKIHNKSELGL